MASVSIEYPFFQAFDDEGVFLVGGEVYTYEPGTTTPQDTYGDRNLQFPNTNPVILDSLGEAAIYTGQAVKLVLTGPGGDPTSPIWTADYIGGTLVTSVTGSAGPPNSPATLNNNYVVTTVPAISALSNNFMLIMTPDLDNVDTIVSTVFTGTGINDLTAAGPYLGTTAGSIFTVEVDSIAVATDTNMQLLLHCDGSGATFVDSETAPKAVTAHGGVTQDATQSKFGGKSALFANAGDYLSCTDSNDWYLAAGDLTVEGWFYFSTVGDATFWAQTQVGGADANNTIYFDYVNSTHKLRFFARDASTTRANYDYTWTPTVATWYHLALVRSGSNLLLFINGTLTTWTTITTAISTNSIGNLTGLLTIGYGVQQGTNFLGYMDEFVWSKGIARYLATFDAPTQAYGGTYDTFKWKKDGGAWNTGIPITSLPQVGYEGVWFTFAVLIGHTLGDIWATTVMTPARVNLDSLGNLLVYKNKGTYIVALDGGDMKAGYPAQLIVNAALNAYLLINPATPTFSTPTISAKRYRKNLIAEYDFTPADEGYLLSCTGTFPINLCTAAAFSGRFAYALVRSGIITLTAQPGELIFGPGSPVGTNTFTLDGSLSSVQIQSNGVDWEILTTAVPRRGHAFIDSTQDWLCPDGVTNPKVTLVSGGGGGASTSDITNTYKGGSGGAGGVKVVWVTTVPGTTYTATIGTAGANGDQGGTIPGSTGGTTSLGALASQTGGTGGGNGTGAGNGGQGNCGNWAGFDGQDGSAGASLRGGRNPLAAVFGDYGRGGNSSSGFGGTPDPGTAGWMLIEW